MPRIAHTVILAAFLSGDITDDKAIRSLTSLLKKHERAAASFAAELSKLDDDALTRNVSSLSASWRLEVSSNPLSFDHVAKRASDIHAQAKDMRNEAKTELFTHHKAGDFNKGRETASYMKTLDSLMVCAANIIANASTIKTLAPEALVA